MKTMKVNQSSISFTSIGSFDNEMIFVEKKSEYRSFVNSDNYLKIIQTKIRNYRRQRNRKFKETKQHVKDDEESIQNYVKNFMPTSEYSFRNL